MPHQPLAFPNMGTGSDLKNKAAAVTVRWPGDGTPAMTVK